MKNKNNYYLLKDAIIITPFRTIEGYNLFVEEGKIARIVKKNILISDVKKFKILDLEGKYFLAPGLIDIHTHGGGGEDCLGGEIEVISKYKLKQGVTGYLPTLMSSPLELIYESFESIKNFNKSGKDLLLPKVLGVHIEGNYLSEKYKGAQILKYLRKPDVNECREIIKASDCLLKIMTLAPELEGCLEIVELLSSYGIISSAGHSNASPKDLDLAINKGLSHITHAFNAMGEMSFFEPGVRYPGMEGYVLVKDELKLEVIGELTHVNPSIMEIIYRTKGKDNIIIITDSLSVSGLGPGKYKMGVSNLTLEENSDIARLEDGGLAGSVVPLNKAVKTFFENTSATLNEAIQMASYNPASSLGISYRKGSIEVGKDADLIVFDKDFEIKKVFIEGKLALDDD